MKSSGFLDIRLYDEPFLLADILALVDGEISYDKKEIIKDKFRKDRVDNSVLEDIKAEIIKLQNDSHDDVWYCAYENCITIINNHIKENTNG